MNLLKVSKAITFTLILLQAEHKKTFELTKRVSSTDTMKSKNGSSPALYPGEPSWT